MSSSQSSGENDVVAEMMKVAKPSSGARLRASLDVALGGILDGQAAKQKLIDLGIEVRLSNRVSHIVSFGKEP